MIQAPETDRAEALCDWAEACALFSRGVSISDVKDELLDGGLATNDSVDPLLSAVRREADRRRIGCAEAYPLTWTDRRIEVTGGWRDAPAYCFMLLLSLTHHYSQLRLSDAASQTPAELFESICVTAYEVYVGGRAIRFGSRRRNPIPTQFEAAVRYVCQETSEDHGHGLFARASLQDDGLDVLAWRPFGDSRSGQLVLLGQCAIGVNWTTKIRELSLERWRGHVRWAVTPLTSISLPLVHSDGVEWRRNLADAGIIFDRVRIAALIHRAGGLTKPLRTAVIGWCRGQLQRLPSS